LSVLKQQAQKSNKGQDFEGRLSERGAGAGKPAGNSGEIGGKCIFHRCETSVKKHIETKVLICVMHWNQENYRLKRSIEEQWEWRPF
jgi:hypothetical protein